jgi:AcrR family transcriptional regulator
VPEVLHGGGTHADHATLETEVSRPLPRTRKGAQTRSQLVDAAKVVFERDGFLNARIVDIAATAGLASGSFYHYFDSKEQIFREVASMQEQRLTAREGRTRTGVATAARVDEEADAHDEEADAHMEAGADRSPWGRIRRANRRYLERYRDDSALMGVIEEVSRYDTGVNAVRMDTMKHFVERAERAIVALQREGLADVRLDPPLAADALGAMVGRFAEQWLVQGYRDYDFDEAVDQLTLIWGNALGMESEHRAARR